MLQRSGIALVLAFLFGFTFLASSSGQAWAAGVELVLPPDQQAYIEDGTTMIPMRAIFERLGAQVQYVSGLPSGDYVRATKGSTTIYLWIGTMDAKLECGYACSKLIRLPKPAVIRDGRTYVPLRFVSESFNAQVSWDAATWTITITQPNENDTFFVRVPKTATQTQAQDQEKAKAAFTQDPKEYFPLEPGRSWTYRVGGRVTVTRTVIKVEGDRVTVRWTGPGGSMDYTYSVSESSIALVDFGGQRTYEPVLKGPLQVGTVWQDSMGLVHEITSVDRTITSNAGALKGVTWANVIEVTVKLSDTTFKRYYAPGVGLVAHIEDSSLIEVLLEYRVPETTSVGSEEGAA
ncbi:MAG: copper amine oxidase N-terminal domain-containing protein [Bacillota bacterium]